MAVQIARRQTGNSLCVPQVKVRARQVRAAAMLRLWLVWSTVTAGTVMNEIKCTMAKNVKWYVTMDMFSLVLIRAAPTVA
jgi:low temperature requirement protein LtrA